MSFKKYNSIENHYRQKHILNCLSQKPELANEKYVALEKIDGANFQVQFGKGKDIKFGKRSSFLDKDSKFFNYQKAVVALSDDLDMIDQAVQTFGYEEMTLYGELFGPGINGRVDYGDSVRILFFDVTINGKFLPYSRFRTLFSFMERLVVPEIGVYNSLAEALEASCDFDSKLLNKEGNSAEGIVIRPMDNEFLMGNGSRFILKKKSDKFKEKETGKKSKKQETLSGEVVTLMMDFRSYVNKNRLIGIFSKHGEIEKPNEMGKFIQLLVEDAREDFLKDHTIPDTLDQKEIKKIFNVGGHAANLLREFL